MGYGRFVDGRVIQARMRAKDERVRREQERRAQHLDTCARCKWNYPDVGYVSDIFTSTQGYLHVCGICALAITNELHGTNMTEFHGEMAEQVRQDCIAYREQAKRG